MCCPYKMGQFIFVLAAAVYFISTALVVLFCVNNKRERRKLLFLIATLAVITAPLTLVTPIGPRCFFPPYLLLITCCVVLFHYLEENLLLTQGIKKSLCFSMLSVCLAIVTFIFSIYLPVHSYDAKRNEYVKKQSDAGFKKVLICRLPNNSYVWAGDPEKEPLFERYKLFYKIDKDVSFKFISRQDFDDFTQNFDQN